MTGKKTESRQTRFVAPKKKRTGHVLETVLQNHICIVFERAIKDGADFEFQGSLEGVYLSPKQVRAAKAGGMRAGFADLNIYLPGGRTVMVELKSKTGRLTQSQRDRHPVLKALGFDVRLVKLKTAADAVAWAENFLKEEVLCGK